MKKQSQSFQFKTIFQTLRFAKVIQHAVTDAQFKILSEIKVESFGDANLKKSLNTGWLGTRVVNGPTSSGPNPAGTRKLI